MGNDIQQITRNTAYHNNLVPQKVRTDVRKYFFSKRVVNIWNQLLVEIKESRSLNIFKTSLLRKLQFWSNVTIILVPEDVSEDKKIFDAERVQDHNSEDFTEIPNMFLPGILGIPPQVNK